MHPGRSQNSALPFAWLSTNPTSSVAVSTAPAVRAVPLRLLTGCMIHPVADHDLEHVISVRDIPLSRTFPARSETRGIPAGIVFCPRIVIVYTLFVATHRRRRKRDPVRIRVVAEQCRRRPPVFESWRNPFPALRKCAIEPELPGHDGIVQTDPQVIQLQRQRRQQCRVATAPRRPRDRSRFPPDCRAARRSAPSEKVKSARSMAPAWSLKIDEPAPPLAAATGR